MNERNLIQRIIDEVCRRGPAGGALRPLCAALIALRGGRTTEVRFVRDVVEWRRQHGEPDRGKLRRWAATLNVEAGIAEAALRATRPDAEEYLVASFCAAPGGAADSGDR
jgi:hypothetical protein